VLLFNICLATGVALFIHHVQSKLIRIKSNEEKRKTKTDKKKERKRIIESKEERKIKPEKRQN
jgi:hypothetical protein